MEIIKNMTNWNLFLDDERNPTDPSRWIVCRSSQEAIEKVKELGFPEYIAFDHDLAVGNKNKNDTAMDFLHWLFENWEEGTPIPDYSVHSSNPSGRANIIAFMESWWKVANNFQPRLAHIDIE